MIIGLTQRVLFHKERAYDSLEHGWYSCLQGHKLVAIPNRIDADIDADLLIITGGNNHPVRDMLGERLIKQFILASKPIIGVCHGAFLLTKIFGGKVSEIDGHMDSEHLVNSIQLVNSYHTLQIEEHPTQSTVLATDEQGCCESWIYKNIGAVVWHPERMNEPYWPKQIEDLFCE